MSVTMKRILGLPKVLTFSPRSPHLSRCSCFVGLVSSFTPTVEPPIPLATTQKIHERLSLTTGQITGNQFLISQIS